MTHRDKTINLEPACFYLRKSREDQEAEARGEGETLAKHKNALFRLAKDYDVNVTKLFEEIVSGESLIHRPEMLELLKEVEEGKWRSVFCMDIDRLGRGKMQDQGLILETFKTAKALIVTPRKIYDLDNEFDEEYTEFEAFMARKELKIITRRLQGGRIRSVEDGNYIGARAPYGYVIQKDAHGRTLLPHPEQADIVKMIFELYTHGLGSNKIANELNRLGAKTYTGKPWEASTVLFIIKNEVYIGRVQWKKKEDKASPLSDQVRSVRTRPRSEWIDVEGKHPPLVSKKVFEAAQTILLRKYHVPFQLVHGITNPLAGIVRCELCGSSMVYRPYSKQLAHLMCYNKLCPNKSTRFAYVEEQVISGLESWLADYRAQWEVHTPSDTTDKSVSIHVKLLRNLKKELKELTQQKESLHDFLERKIYDEATYLDRFVILSERIKETESSIVQAEELLTTENQRERARKDMIPRLQKVLTLYKKTSDPAAKNKLLKSVLEKVTYRKEKYQIGADFELILYPLLPR